MPGVRVDEYAAMIIRRSSQWSSQLTIRQTRLLVIEDVRETSSPNSMLTMVDILVPVPSGAREERRLALANVRIDAGGSACSVATRVVAALKFSLMRPGLGVT